MKKLDANVVPIVVSLVIVAGGFGISHLTNILPWKDLWVAFGISISLITITVYAGVLYVIPILLKGVVDRNKSIEDSMKNVFDRIERRFRQIEERLDVARPFEDPDWVVTTRELVEIEACIPQKEVWIVSSYLGGELSEDQFAPTIRGNVERGVIYYYVIPDDPQTEARIKAIREMVGGKSSVKAIRFAERLLFNLVSAHDTCVFDPFERTQAACTGYMNVTTSIKDKDYFIRLSPQYCQRLIATVKKMGEPIDLDK